MIVKLLLLEILLVLISSCTMESKFDKEKWNNKDDFTYAYRKIMLKDLTENYQLEGITYKQLTQLIGTPDNIVGDKNRIYYEIVTEYKRDIDPTYIKILIFEIGNDSIVTNFEIEEHKK